MHAKRYKASIKNHVIVRLNIVRETHGFVRRDGKYRLYF